MHTWTRLILPGAILLFFAVDARASRTTDTDNLRADVIDCEEALARLTNCCPGFDPKRVQCTYYYDHSHDEGCTGSVSDSTTRETPALDIEESKCVLSRSCDELVEGGVCTRAQEAVERIQSSSTSAGGDGLFGGGSGSTHTEENQDHPRVCK